MIVNRTTNIGDNNKENKTVVGECKTRKMTHEDHKKYSKMQGDGKKVSRMYVWANAKIV